MPENTEPKSAYVICWRPTGDFGDHDLNELVHAAAFTEIEAVQAARDLAKRKAEQQDEYRGSFGGVDVAADPTPVLGLDECIARLAEPSKYHDPTLHVGEGEDHYGDVVILAVNRA